MELVENPARQHNGRLCCLLLVLGLFCSPLMAAQSLTPHTAEYKVRISIVSGKLRTELQATENDYVARHSVAPTGLSRLVARGTVSEESKFSLAADGVTPVAYSSEDTLASDEVRADIRFDWDSNEARGTVNQEEVLTVLDGLTHDRVSIQYALMYDLLNEKLGSQYRMFEIDKLKTLNVRSIGTKRVKVPAGTFEVVGIQHQAENSSRITTLWCAKELDFLPVVIEQHRKGKRRVRATLRNYTPTN